MILNKLVTGTWIFIYCESKTAVFWTKTNNVKQDFAYTVKNNLK